MKLIFFNSPGIVPFFFSFSFSSLHLSLDDIAVSLWLGAFFFFLWQSINSLLFSSLQTNSRTTQLTSTIDLFILFIDSILITFINRKYYPLNKKKKNLIIIIIKNNTIFDLLNFPTNG